MRGKRWLLGLAAGLPALLLILVVLVIVTANTSGGRALLVRTVAGATGGAVRLSGLSGRFPDALRLDRLTVADADGPWLTLEDLALDWSPSHLLLGRADVERLEAGRVGIDRLPAPSDEPSDGAGIGLPLPVNLGKVGVARLELAEPVIGQAAVLAVEGRGTLDAESNATVDLALRRLDGEAAYTLRGRLDPAAVQARLAVREPAHGLISAAAGLPDLGDIVLEAGLQGPRSAVTVELALNAGPLSLSAAGRLNLEDETADLTLKGSAPAMNPAPALAWQGIALDAGLHGPFRRPALRAELRIDALSAAGVAVPRIAATLRGDAGAASLHAEFDRLRLPGSRPGLFQTAPLRLQADARLDDPRRPVVVNLDHPLLALKGQARTADGIEGELTLALPDLSPFAAAGGLDLRGRLEAASRFAVQGDTARAQADATLAVTSGAAPWPDLIGNAAKFGLTLAMSGGEVAVPRLDFTGARLALSARGTLAGRASDLSWKLALPELGALGTALAGRLALEGRLNGPLDDFAVTADLNGELAAGGMPKGPLTARLEARGLPRAPTGRISARGALAGSPLVLAVQAGQAESGLRIAIEQAQWKSARAEGSFALPRGASLPGGRLVLRMSRLDDLRPLTGRSLSGSLDATLESSERGGRPQAILRADLRDFGLAGTAALAMSRLTLSVADPAGRPDLDGRLSLAGLKLGDFSGSAELRANGALNALDLRLSADLAELEGSPLNLGGAARLDLPGRRAAVTELHADWKRETLGLLAPARITFADAVAVDRLLLGVRKAELELAGRVSPSLDLELAVRGLPADLAALAAPSFAADGTVSGEARLIGSAQRPDGSVRLAVQGLRLREGPGRGLPPANLTADARLRRGMAELEAHLKAGPRADLRLSGDLPLDTSRELDLRTSGEIDLSLLDPLLAAQGRRLRGRTSLNAAVAGTAGEPRASGSLRLAQGEFQDYGQGLRLHDMSAELWADGGTLRLTNFRGRAGPGTIDAGGTLDWLAPGRPIDLTLTARNAQPVSGDRFTVNLDADLRLRGRSEEKLAVAGDIRIQRAEIRIPERMPAQIAVLDVRLPGTRPPVRQPKPALAIGLDLTVTAPGRIFARGRGLDAELGGKLRLKGTSAEPVPEGSFAMRRGEFTLAGKTLNFSKGVVGFDGGSLTDPSLNFVSSTTNNNITATLSVGGTARKPTIALSSSPPLPQDEVLAHLLFSRDSADLSPLEMVQIAGAIASLTGVTSGAGDPLGGVRKGLGLDRLSIGGGSAPTLEAGRYVAPGVYVGARQGVSTNSSQATVQIDVTDNLKLEGAVGTGSTTSTGAASGAGSGSVGLRYQYEY